MFPRGFPRRDITATCVDPPNTGGKNALRNVPSELNGPEARIRKARERGKALTLYGPARKLVVMKSVAQSAAAKGRIAC